MPRALPPVDEAPDGIEWKHEFKFDGYRTEITTNIRDMRVSTRSGNDWGAKYRNVINSARIRGAAQLSWTTKRACVHNVEGVTGFGATPTFHLRPEASFRVCRQAKPNFTPCFVRLG